MNADVLIRMPMYIEVQGDDALGLVEYSPERTVYQVNGFSAPRLFLIDERKETNAALGQMLRADDVSRFAWHFCGPAETVVEQTQQGDLRMYLSESSTSIPELMCWIVVDIEGAFPEYPALIQEVQAVDKDHSAGLCIYPLDQEQMAEFIEAAGSAVAGQSARPE